MTSRYFPHHHRFIIPTNRIYILIFSIKQHTNHMTRMPPIRPAFGSFQSRIAIQINETPIIPSCQDILCIAPINCIHMVPPCLPRIDPLNPPPSPHRIGIPHLILEHYSPIQFLLAALRLEEQVFRGPAIALNILSICGPVDIGDEGVVA